MPAPRSNPPEDDVPNRPASQDTAAKIMDVVRGVLNQQKELYERVDALERRMTAVEAGHRWNGGPAPL